MIKDICKADQHIPLLDTEAAEKLLYSLRPQVCDHWSISASHYINGGPSAIKHFQLIINTAISDLENTTCDEFNTAHAQVLYKGHKKDKTLASSYRTISSCPFVAKALDTYIRELSLDDWEAAQSQVQFLGSGKSHELGAVLLTEVIQHSIHINNGPVFCLFLDARSAFDKTIREIMIRNLFTLGTDGGRLLYLDNRLKHRKTFCEWDRKVMGPIHDEQGVEQGGVPSGDLYITYNNEQLDVAQESGLGVHVHDLHVGSVGQADDVALLSADVFFLSHLLQLTMDYCAKYHVTLAPEKTKLVAFAAPHHHQLVEYQKLVSPINIKDVHIEFATSAEHVGIVRSVEGNLPNILDRICSHRGKLFSLLPAGLSRKKNVNPAAAIRVENIYALPCLLSGVGSLVLSTPEIGILNDHYKNTLQMLMKLVDKTPLEVILFLSGSLPAEAHIHMRQLGLFLMITELPDNILNTMATKALYSDKDSSKSWFIQIRKLSMMYDLPSPLALLSSPMSKHTYKSLIKSRVTDYWERKLRLSAAPKDSLVYFKPEYMSLRRCHPIWSSCKANPYEVNKAIVQARLLSGRYRCDWSCRHWSRTNKDGFCVLCPDENFPGTVEHMLVSCPALQEKRLFLKNHWDQLSCEDVPLRKLLRSKLSSSPQELVQFLLDPSAVPEIIAGCQQGHFKLDTLFSLTRTYCYALHRRRCQLAGIWNRK